MELSRLHFHSLGLVANNKARGSKEIRVTLTELRFSHDEVVVTNPTEESVTYHTDQGQDQITVTSDQTVKAVWLKLNSNRVTAPDVRRNDQVLVWRLGEDQYFWTDLNISNVKRLETVVYAWSADPNKPIADDFSNAYLLEVSTHDKHVSLRTCQFNGEPFGYTIQLNTGDGIFTVLDTAGNTVYVNSRDTVIGAKNAVGTEWRLDKKNLIGYAPDSAVLKVEKLIKLICRDFEMVASDSVTVKTNNTLIDSPTTKFTGEVEIPTLKAGSVSATTLAADSATFKTHGPH